MTLQIVWFIAIATLWAGYLVLEGFDFGVGMVLRAIGHDDAERGAVMRTIGPVWDGNEVWMIVAGAGTFAAFPQWYATMFSGFYIPLLAILLSLIIRAVAIEFRGKRDDVRWRRWCDLGIIAGSLVAALLWGVALANLVHGVPIGQDGEYSGGAFTLLNPFSLLGGVTVVCLFVTHGLFFLCLRTSGVLRERARRYALRAGVLTIMIGAAWLAWAAIAHGHGAISWIASIIAAGALVGAWLAAVRSRDGLAFGLGVVAVLACAAFIFGTLFPRVMPSTLDPAWSLTIGNASSSPYTLKIMTIVTAVFLPIVLLYQGWTYWVFRQRLTTAHLPPAGGLPRVPQRG